MNDQEELRRAYEKAVVEEGRTYRTWVIAKQDLNDAKGAYEQAC